MTEAHEAPDHAKAARFAAQVRKAERILAFKYKVEEALPGIAGIEQLEVVVQELVNKMSQHALTLMFAAFTEAGDDDEAPTEKSDDRVVH